jgi:hypothetical protein
LQKKQQTRAGYGPKASHQLHAAEDRIAELEAEVTAYQKESTEPNNRSIASTRRLKIDFFSRNLADAVRAACRRRAMGK